MTGFAETYLRETADIVAALDADMIEKMVQGLARIRDKGGRLFILGVGGSAGHAGHAVNDFRKICGFEAYAPTDNVAELTARTNDEGWDTVFAEWLKGSRLDGDDAILVFSVGGGNEEKRRDEKRRDDPCVAHACLSCAGGLAPATSGRRVVRCCAESRNQLTARLPGSGVPGSCRE